MSRLPGHQTRNMLNQLVVTNQCCFCSSVFADIITTQHHVARSYAKRICHVDLGYKKHAPTQPLSLDCPWKELVDNEGKCICDFQASHLKQLHMHITEHLDWHPDLKLTMQPDKVSTTYVSPDIVQSSRDFESTETVQPASRTSSRHGAARHGGGGVDGPRE